MLNEKLKYLSWFAKRPQFLPELIRRVLRNVSGAYAKGVKTREEMQSWCAERGIDTTTVLSRLTDVKNPVPVEMLFAQEFTQAKRVQAACPEPMGGPGNLTLLYWAAEYLQAHKVIETGVAYGWSSLAILLSLNQRASASLISTDMPYPGRNNGAHVGCVVPEELKASWTIIRLADRQALPRAIGMLPSIDLCHYDSDKSYGGRMWAYPRLWSALRSGAWFVSDDIGDNVAFRDFAASVRCEPIVVATGSHYVGILVKP